MKADRFARALARIEANRERSERWRKRATRHLVEHAGCRVIAYGSKVLRYQLASGECVCVKERYRTEGAANDDLFNIARRPGAHLKPVRAYLCPHCSGFHLTSQARP